MDESSWSILPDWEVSRGITHNILLVTKDSPNTLMHPLEATFRGDIFFLPVVRHLLGKNTGASLSEHKRAMHGAEGFSIDHGKLWRVSAKPSDRAARTECIPTAEGFQ